MSVRIGRSKARELAFAYEAYRDRAVSDAQSERDAATRLANERTAFDAAVERGEEPGDYPMPTPVTQDIDPGAMIYRLARTIARPKARKIFIVTAIVNEYGDGGPGSRTRTQYAVAAMSERAARAMVEDELAGGEYEIVSVERRDNPWMFQTGPQD